MHRCLHLDGLVLQRHLRSLARCGEFNLCGYVVSLDRVARRQSVRFRQALYLAKRCAPDLAHDTVQRTKAVRKALFASTLAIRHVAHESCELLLGLSHDPVDLLPAVS